MVAEDVVFGNQLHTGMRFSVVEQQTVAVHTVAALPPDQAADLPKLSCLNFNEHLTSFPVTLNKSENAMGNIIYSPSCVLSLRGRILSGLRELKSVTSNCMLCVTLPKRTFLTGNPARRCAVSLPAALAP